VPSKAGLVYEARLVQVSQIVWLSSRLRDQLAWSRLANSRPRPLARADLLPGGVILPP
jgi:hypothetical protein